MRMKKTLTILITIFFFVSMIGAASADTSKTPPHLIYGYIKDDGNEVSGIDVKVVTEDGKTLASTTTDSEGYYKLKPNDDNLDGTTLNLYVDDEDTGKGTTYKTGKVEQINHDGNYISDDTGSDSNGGGGFGGAPSPGKSPEPKKITVEVNNNAASTAIGTVQENQQVTVELQSQEGKKSSNINQISFKSNSAAQNVEISVKSHGNNKPEDVPSATESDSETVHSYMEINHKNLKNENIAEATITFSVEKSWLEKNNRNPSDVGVKRFHGEDWENIEVNQFDETDTHYVYKARTPGFSYYSIYLKGTDEATGGTSEESDDTKEPSGSSDQTGDDKEGIPGLTIFGIVALIALVAVAAVTTLKRQQQK